MRGPLDESDIQSIIQLPAKAFMRTWDGRYVALRDRREFRIGQIELAPRNRGGVQSGTAGHVAGHRIGDGRAERGRIAGIRATPP